MRATTSSFEQFRQRILAEPALLERLRAIDDHEQFMISTLLLAHEVGFEISREELDMALRSARREWIERWIE